MSKSAKGKQIKWLTIAPDNMVLWALAGILFFTSVIYPGSPGMLGCAAFLLLSSVVLAVTPVRRRFGMSVPPAATGRSRPCPACTGRHGPPARPGCVTCDGTGEIIDHPQGKGLIDAMPARSARLDWTVILRHEMDLYKRTFRHPGASCTCKTGHAQDGPDGRADEMACYGTCEPCIVHPRDRRWLAPEWQVENPPALGTAALPPAPYVVGPEALLSGDPVKPGSAPSGIADEWAAGADLIIRKPDGTARYPRKARVHRAADRKLLSEMKPGDTATFAAPGGAGHLVLREDPRMWSCCGGAYFNAASLEYHLRSARKQQPDQARLLLTGMLAGTARSVGEPGYLREPHEVVRTGNDSWRCVTCKRSDGIAGMTGHVLYGHKMRDRLSESDRQIAQAVLADLTDTGSAHGRSPEVLPDYPDLCT